MRRILSWVFVRGPAAFYAFADGNAGSTLFSVLVLLALAAATGLGAGIGALIGWLTASQVDDFAFAGSMIGLGALIAWMIWSLLLAAVLWVRGVAPVAVGKPSQGKHAASALGWRRPGEPLVPGALVAFFALMTVLATAGSLYSGYQSRPLPSPTMLVNGVVVEEHEPAWFSKDAGSVVIRYDVPGGHRSFETKRDPGERYLRLGDVVPVEYSQQQPTNGRSTWVAEDAQVESTFLRYAALLCAGLGLLSGAGWGVGRWRASGLRSGGSQSDTQTSA